MGKDVGEVHAIDEEIAQLCYEVRASQEKIESFVSVYPADPVSSGVTQPEREVERELCIEIT